MDNGTKFEEGEYEVCLLTRDTLKDAISVMINSYFPDEGVAKAVGLLKSPEAAQEIVDFFSSIAEDGVSFVVIEKSTKTVLGAAFGALRVKSSDRMQMFIDRCRHPSSKMWLKVKNDVATAKDLFGLCDTKCMCEVVAGAVTRGRRSNGIARGLLQRVVQYAQSLANSDVVRLSLDCKPMPLEELPGAVIGVPTVDAIQQLLPTMGFTTAAEMKYSSFVFDGKPLGALSDMEEKYIKLMYLPIENVKSKY